MSDIFISYSRKDSSQALELADRLRMSGMDVWIDQHGIEAATSWSGEIVEAIWACKAFMLLLSESSLASDNVVKELSIAAEKKKPIVPLEFGAIDLTKDFAYQLAGLQRVAHTDFDAILRSLAKLGISKTIISSEIRPPPSTPKDSRKSLMILPFEDLSPTQDNGWFADGIVSEMLSALGNVKALRLIDWNTAKEFKTRKVPTATLAKELEVRYFLEGQVRKAGENIKVSVSLLDFETGDHLWQDSMKGTMQDVFEIQETVAEKVVEGLKIHLGTDEKKKLSERGTDNAEAYELLLKANEYSARGTREGNLLAVKQISLAIELDPNFADALHLKASQLANLYRVYDRNPDLLIEAERLAKRALENKPDLWNAYVSVSNVYRLQGRLREAEDAAKEYVRREPDESSSHFNLGFFYSETNQPALAIAPFEKAIELEPNDLHNYTNLIGALNEVHDTARVEQWSQTALPLFERRLRNVPDDEQARVDYAVLLRRAGESGKAIEALAPLLDKQNLDGRSLYNIGCLYATLNDSSHAIEALRRSVAAGFRYVELFRTDSDLDSLREREEFKELLAGL